MENEERKEEEKETKSGALGVDHGCSRDYQ